MKTCTKCRCRLRDTAFYVRRDAGSLSSWCRACVKKADQKRRKAHPERGRMYSMKCARTIKSLFGTAKGVARGFGWSWGLSFDQYKRLRKKPCRYCGHPLNPTGVGLDRKDNTRGYEPGNVTPCCRQCNVAKNHWFTYKEMLVIGLAVKQVKDARMSKM